MKLLLLLICLQTWSVYCERMPRFVYSEASKLLLVWSDVWEAGSQNSMALLSKDSKLTLRVRVDGVPGGSGLKRTLLVSCPTKATVDSVDLASLTTSTSTDLCTIPNDIRFSLKSLSTSTDEFELRMGTSSVPFSGVFSSKVIITARVEYAGGGVLTSNTLSIWNLDPISDFPQDSPTPAGYQRHFLTEPSIQLMTRMNLGTGDFHNFPFLDNRIVSALQSAPSFFRHKLNMGAILYFDPSGCSSVQNDRSFLFTTFDSKISGFGMERMKTMFLDRTTGILWYARCQLYQSVAEFYSQRRSPSEIAICLSVSFSGDVVPYSKISEVRSRIPSTDFSYTMCPDPLSSTCTLVRGTQENVTIYSGMDSSQLVCPIICGDPTTVFTFYRNGQLLIPPRSSDWSDFGTQGVRISRTSNIIEFSKDVSSIQAGEYRCTAGMTASVSFTFYVSVVSMPTFATTFGGHSGTLPPKVFAMQGESLSYSCGVSFSGLRSSVSLDPKFYLPSVSGGVVNWAEQNLAAFNSRVSRSGSSAVGISYPAAGSGFQLMNVSIESVPPQQASFGTNFTHRFLCSASVPSAGAMELGMSSYTAQTGGDVVFVPRPTKDSFVLDPSNDCVTQKCNLGNGATFKFALSPEFSAHLSYIGVDVDLFLRIDYFLLTDVRILMNETVSVIKSNGTSITYQILPIAREDVRTELQKRSSLTPVFNFRYKNAADMGNVNMLKSRYGAPVVALGSKDCRADPMCFYSTDFDTSGSLSFLSVNLDFKSPEPPLSGANLTIMIVIIVVCVVLIIVLVVLVVYFANRPPAKTYHLEEKELEQGHNPNAEAKEEEFKEYVRQSERASYTEPVGERDIAMHPTAYDNSSFLYENAHNSRALEPEDIHVYQGDEV